MNKEYWQRVYRENHYMDTPSSFASFCYLNQMKENGSIIDIGCGNFRDSIYFINHNIQTISVDQVKVDLPSNRINYIESDIKNLNVIKCKYYYMRWLLQAIDDEEEKYLFYWLEKSCLNNSIILIECRSDKDDNIMGDKHHRRLINKDNLKNKIESMDFKMTYLDENRGFSKVGDDDPLLIRLVAIKNKKINGL